MKKINKDWNICSEWRERLSTNSKLYETYLRETIKFLDGLQDVNILLTNRIYQIIGWNIVFITALIAILFKGIDGLLYVLLICIIFLLIASCVYNLWNVVPKATTAKGIIPQQFFTLDILRHVENIKQERGEYIFYLESLNKTILKELKRNKRGIKEKRYT